MVGNWSHVCFVTHLELLEIALAAARPRIRVCILLHPVCSSNWTFLRGNRIQIHKSAWELYVDEKNVLYCTHDTICDQNLTNSKLCGPKLGRLYMQYIPAAASLIADDKLGSSWFFQCGNRGLRLLHHSHHVMLVCDPSFGWYQTRQWICPGWPDCE